MCRFAFPIIALFIVIIVTLLYTFLTVFWWPRGFDPYPWDEAGGLVYLGSLIALLLYAFQFLQLRSLTSMGGKQKPMPTWPMCWRLMRLDGLRAILPSCPHCWEPTIHPEFMLRSHDLWGRYAGIAPDSFSAAAVAGRSALTPEIFSCCRFEWMSYS